jgi:hypothetical protein
MIECKGQRVAILAYCSVLHEGAAAGPDSPGVAPMRASARFEAVDYQPGVPPRVITTPNILLPGYQAGALQTRPQSSLEERLHRLGVGVEHALPDADESYGQKLVTA